MYLCHFTYVIFLGGGSLSSIHPLECKLHEAKKLYLFYCSLMYLWSHKQGLAHGRHSVLLNELLYFGLYIWIPSTAF